MIEDFRLHEWTVRPHQNCLCRGDTEVKIDPKAMQVLVRLSEDSGQVVTKEELFNVGVSLRIEDNIAAVVAPWKGLCPVAIS